ncbi:hypothetical protein PZN02_006139 (plasmid) [Sinorhizobium garamanticum]|uniref:Transmembrane protein n=1 Tax=Sinorhizobium garamanticum TaxID=680247 RepID=A0ABY8DQY4_9HYPH|nr:hypothetical protein [Sinorhizobium garamanticum]WEX91376.1 hypothetical protein PZN02_006139 [Sinorhizobium garamanticum]
MWTCPIILLAVQPSVPIVVVALHRGSEVILGALVGWVFHWVAETLVDAVVGDEPGHQEARRAYGWPKRRIGTRRIEG